MAFEIIYYSVYMNYYDNNDYKSYDIGLPEFILIVYVVFFLILFIPGISVTVRRLHDTGRSWLYIFVSFIPFAGPFILLYFCCLDSEERPNEYGPSPKFILNQPINPAPISLYPQQNYDQATVSPYPQAPMVQPYPQPNPMPPQPYMAPPQGPYPGQGNPYP